MSIIAGYILPHPPLAVHEVGKGMEEGISATIAGYEKVAESIARLKPDTIVIISPHSAYYSDWIYIAGGISAEGDLSQFGAEEVKIRLDYDIALRDAIEELARERSIPAGSNGRSSKPLDHGMMVPLYFVDKVYSSENYKAVSIGGSALSRDVLEAFGRCISDAVHKLDSRCVMIASGDLSHRLTTDGPYGFDPAGPIFDSRFGEIIRSGDLSGLMDLDPIMCEDAAECGLSGFIMLYGALAEGSERYGIEYSSELLSIEGPFGVGYGVAAFEALYDGEVETTYDEGTEMEIAGSSMDPLVQLARRTIYEHITNGTIIMPVDFPNSEPDRAGCFVSIHTASSGDLRGCIGTIAPVQDTLAEEIIMNAISASTRDPRFPPIDASELDNLEINVDVMGMPEPASIEDLDPKKYGVIVSKAGRRGLLLPDLEGVDSIEQQLMIACNKAGITPSLGFTDIDIERFEVVRHE